MKILSLSYGTGGWAVALADDAPDYFELLEENKILKEQLKQAKSSSEVTKDDGVR